MQYMLTAIISAAELITRYYSNEKLAQCCFNVRPTSATLAYNKLTFGECVICKMRGTKVDLGKWQAGTPANCPNQTPITIIQFAVLATLSE